MAPRFEQQGPSGSEPVIQGYDQTGFRVSGERFQGAILVTPSRAVAWPVASLEALTIGDFDLLSSETVEVLLLGTGATLRRPAKELLDGLRERGLAVELMDSRAAARTHAVLVGEGRLVAATLLPLQP